MSPFDVMDKLFVIAESLKKLDPVIADVKVIVTDVGKLIEDVQAMIPQAAEPHTVGSPRPHRLLKAFVRNRVVAGAVHQTGKTWDECAKAYDGKVDNPTLMGAFAAEGVEAPTVGGSFADWLASVDWAKVFDVIAKLIALILPLLM